MATAVAAALLAAPSALARSGPAPWAESRPPSDPAREAVADAKRDELIADLRRLLPRMEEGSRKAELLFQLAEYHWEKSRFLSLQEVKEYDDAYGRWMAARDAQGVKAAGPPPQVSTRRSDAARAEALAVYRALLADQPRYPRKDELLFVVGYDLDESGDKAGALQTYQRLVAEHPESRFVPDAWVQIGEHYFAANDLARARSAYEQAARGAKAKIYAFALYKLAWCDYNAGDVRGAIDKFQRVVAYAQAQDVDARRDRIQLAGEALQDLVLAFARADEIDSAVAYFQDKDPARALELESRLGAATFFDSGKFEEAIRVYRRLEEQAPGHARAPAWQQKIALAYDKLNLREDVARETRRLVGEFGPGSAWASAHAAEPGVVAEGRDLAETALRELAQEAHQEAARTKAAATYRLARDLYRQYLETFPDAASAGLLRFYRAETLYALEDWEAAADQYDDAAAGGAREIAQRAANAQIVALEKALAVPNAASVRAAEGATGAAEEPIPPLEQKLLRACERYLAVVPGAKDEVVIRYKAALIHYDHRRYPEAARRFGEIIQRWPGDAWAQKAADLSMNILEARRDWPSLATLAGSFHQNARLAPPGSELWRRTATVAENARFYAVLDLYQGQEDPAAAARGFSRFVDAYPASPNAPVALHNAIVIAEAADELDRVIASGERFLRDYPRADGAVARPALLSLASAYRRTGRLEDAARHCFRRSWRRPRLNATRTASGCAP
ncbi:MAG: hypothetical protein NVS4B10_20990 [Myxococcales bacterium]